MDWVALIDERTRKLGLEYYHFFYSPEGYADHWLTESYAVYPYDVEGDEYDYRYLESIMEWDYFFHLGQDDYLFALANAQNKDSGCVTAAGWGLYEITDTGEREESVYPPSLSGFMQNVALFYGVREPTLRSVGFILASHDLEDPHTGLFHDPDEYDYIQSYDYLSSFEPLYQELGWRDSDAPLPTANLVVMEPSSPEALELFEEHLLAVLPTVTNALYCAGYRPFATLGDYLPEAELYYVFAPGWLDDGAVGDLDEKVLEIADTGKRCFLHPLGLLSANETPSWMDFIGGAFGITDSEGLEAEGEGSPLPASVQWSFDGEAQDIKLRGLGLFEELSELDQGWEHLINHLDTNGDVEVVLMGESAAAEDGDIPLILKKGGCYLMNLGNRLHLEFSNILANIFAGEEIIHQPGFFHASLTPSRSALLVLRDCMCDITLPRGGTLVEFDKRGRRLEEPNLEIEGNRLQGQLKRWHLVVVVGVRS